MQTGPTRFAISTRILNILFRRRSRVPTTENSEARTAVLLCSSLVTTLGKVKIVSLPVTKRCYQYCSTVHIAYIDNWVNQIS